MTITAFAIMLMGFVTLMPVVKNVDAQDNSTYENDTLGIRMIYPTNTTAGAPEPWLLNENWMERTLNWEDDEEEEGTHITEKSTADGLELKVTNNDDEKPGQVRLPVLAVSNESSLDDLELDQDVLRIQGYMGTPMDWKNVELTLYAKVNNASGSVDGGQHFEFLARGGQHGGDSDECEGTALHANLKLDGTAKREKELYHEYPDGYTPTVGNTKDLAIDNLKDRWIGMKGIFYNQKDGNVKLELWVDNTATNNWGDVPVYSIEDKGEWEIEGNNICEGTSKEKITWGGPVTIFRWDNLQDVDIKLASVREIIPPK